MVADSGIESEERETLAGDLSSLLKVRQRLRSFERWCWLIIDNDSWLR